MKRNLRALRVALFVALVATSQWGWCGDGAYPQAIGFSGDGSRFAFLEWGQQDGSGFSYASVFFLDLVTDQWLTAPVRTFIEDEQSTPMAAYMAAWEKAKTRLEKFSVHMPARLVYARPFGFPDREPVEQEIRWQGPSVLSGTDVKATIHMKVFEIDVKSCTETAYGFALSWNRREFYRDTKISRSRGCPVAYSIERVYFPDSLLKPTYAVALIGVYSRGFEGSDLRHIAIPVPLR